MEKMKIDLTKMLEKIYDEKSYIKTMKCLAAIGVSYRALDKLHYLVNEKLGICSEFGEISHYAGGAAVRCPKCGHYICNENWQCAELLLVIDGDRYLLRERTYFDGYSEVTCGACGHEFDFMSEE